MEYNCHDSIHTYTGSKDISCETLGLLASVHRINMILKSPLSLKPTLSNRWPHYR